MFGLTPYSFPYSFFRIKRIDGWTLLVTFVVTLGVGIDQGILTGILFSLVLFVARSSHPRTVTLGYRAADNSYRDIRRHPAVATDPEMILIRVDSSLYFANARFVEDRVRESMAVTPRARWVVMDMSGVNDVDAVAVSTLDNLMEEAGDQGVRFAFAGMKTQVRKVVERAGWPQRLGPAMDYPSLETAVREVRKAASEPADTDASPNDGRSGFTP